MSNALGPARAAALMRQKLDARVQARADQLRDIVVETHATAPRGGSYLNRFGQNRSAAGEAPAEETGQLMSILEMPPSPIQGGFSVPINYAVLEFGFTVGARSRLSDRATLAGNAVAARPMGRMAVAKLRQEVESGG